MAGTARTQPRGRIAANQLGVDFCLGSHVWDRQHKFRIRLGPLTLDDYMGMLPGQQPFNELVAWVAEYLGHELDWDLNLVLQQPRSSGAATQRPVPPGLQHLARPTCT